MNLFAEQWNDLFGAVHALVALLMLFAFVMGLIFLLGVSLHNWRHIQIASLIATLSYLATFGAGTLLYPHFKVAVRSAFLDARAPHSVGLFVIKENLSAIGVCIALALLVLILFGHLRRASTWRRQLFAALFVMLALLACIVSGIAFFLETRR